MRIGAARLSGTRQRHGTLVLAAQPQGDDQHDDAEGDRVHGEPQRR
jgi:hypothetical protein